MEKEITLEENDNQLIEELSNMYLKKYGLDGGLYDISKEKELLEADRQLEQYYEFVNGSNEPEKKK